VPGKRGKKAARMRYVAFACHAPLRDFAHPSSLRQPPTRSFEPPPTGALHARVVVLPAAFWHPLSREAHGRAESAALTSCRFILLSIFFSGLFWSFGSLKWPLQNWFVWSPKAHTTYS